MSTITRILNKKTNKRAPVTLSSRRPSNNSSDGSGRAAQGMFVESQQVGYSHLHATEDLNVAFRALLISCHYAYNHLERPFRPFRLLVHMQVQEG